MPVTIIRQTAPLWGYTLLTLLLTLPLSLNLTTSVPSDIGDPLLNTWILAWGSYALLADPSNLFNANIFHPLPNTLAYSEHLLSTVGLLLPLHLPLSEPILTYNLAFLLSFPLSAYSMYLLTLHWTGQRQAALISGLIFGFAPYRFAALAHLQLLTWQWLPLIVLAVDKLTPAPDDANAPLADRQPNRWSLLLTVTLVGQMLTSWYLAVYTLLIVGLYLLAHHGRILSASSRPPSRRYGRLLLTLLLAAVLIVPIAWPYLDMVDQLQASRPLANALSLAASPTDYLAAAPFNRLSGEMSHPFRQRPNFTQENLLFIGLIPPLLLLIACLRLTTRRLSLLLIFGLTISLTFAAPYHLLATLIPPTTIIRVPPRWVIPAIFALAGLAAYGYATVHQRIRPKWGRHALFSLTALGLLAETTSAPLPLAPVENRTQLKPAYHWLAAQPNAADIALVELPMYRDPEYPEVKRLVASTLGWWRLVNGYSGYLPPRHHELALALESFPNQTALTALQNFVDLGERPLYLLVHPDEAPFSRPTWETTQRWQAERHPALTPQGVFAGDYLYQLNPPQPRRANELATFGGQIRLLHAEAVGGQLTLHWQTTTPIETAYTVFVHLRAQDGFVRAQADGPPVRNHYPTTAWSVGETVQDVRPLPDVPYDHLAIGLYDPLTDVRLSAVGSDGAPLVDNALILRTP